MSTHANRVQMTVTGTPGTGTVTLNAASSGYRTFGTAYGGNATVDILITEGTAWEVARNCTYTHSGATVTRGTLESSSTGSAISFTSAAIVSVIATAYEGQTWTDLAGVFGSNVIAVTGAVTATIGAMHHCTGTSADYTVTLPAASGNSGKMLGFRMGSAAGLTKLVTLDGNASETIDGATTRVMWAAETAILYCDGSNWFKIAGKSRAMLCVMRLSADQTGVTTGATTKCNIDATVLDNTALMADTTNKRINIKRAGEYLVTGLARMDNFAATAISTQLWKDGSAFAQSISATPTSGHFGIPCVAPVTCTAGQYIELAAYHNAAGNEVFEGGALADGVCFLSISEVPQW